MNAACATDRSSRCSCQCPISACCPCKCDRLSECESLCLSDGRLTLRIIDSRQVAVGCSAGGIPSARDRYHSQRAPAQKCGAERDPTRDPVGAFYRPGESDDVEGQIDTPSTTAPPSCWRFSSVALRCEWSPPIHRNTHPPPSPSCSPSWASTIQTRQATAAVNTRDEPRK